tara:strand:- start:169 stop:372 length:204 start_codon:yes stop_codon:yes gene_type:complete
MKLLSLGFFLMLVDGLPNGDHITGWNIFEKLISKLNIIKTDGSITTKGVPDNLSHLIGAHTVRFLDS